MHPAEVSSRWMHRQSIIPGQATTSRRPSGVSSRNTTALSEEPLSRASLLFISSLDRAVARIRPPRSKSYSLSGFRVHRVPADTYNRVTGTPALMGTRIKSARLVGTTTTIPSFLLPLKNSFDEPKKLVKGRANWH